VLSDEHNWHGTELKNYTIRFGNIELSTQQASSSLPTFFDRKLDIQAETIREVSAFLATCQSVQDIDQFRLPEWWVHPVNFERYKRGDCEDHALFAWRVLHDLGHNVRLMLGLVRGTGHAWVQLYQDKTSFILETTAKRDVDPSIASGYVPEFSFQRMSDGGFKMYSHNPEMIEVIESMPIEPLSLPEHWMGIDQLIFAGKKNEAHRAIRLAMQGKGSHTRKFLDRYAYLREHDPDLFELDDEAYWADWAS